MRLTPHEQEQHANKAYSIIAVDIFRIQDGKLAGHWDVIDGHELFTQLGVIE